jgi:hypothetical protein
MDDIKTIGKSPEWEEDAPVEAWSVKLFKHGPIPEGVEPIGASDGVAASPNPIHGAAGAEGEPETSGEA